MEQGIEGILDLEQGIETGRRVRTLTRGLRPSLKPPLFPSLLGQGISLGGSQICDDARMSWAA
jgi:hypothetical protein